MVVLAAVSVAAALLLSQPLHDWVNDTSPDGHARVLLWIGVLVVAGALVVGLSFALWRLARLAIRRRARGLAKTIHLAIMCRQSCRQLSMEAATEQNPNVGFQHYCELGRHVAEQLELLWRGSAESLMQMSGRGLDLSTAEALMHAADKHCNVEIGAPLGVNPSGSTDRMARIQQAGFGGRCVALLLDQLIADLSDASGCRAMKQGG